MPRKLRLRDFWSWAFSDLIGNTERGKLAEYIVATALECDGAPRSVWESFDLLFGDMKIEVKASAYIQSWEQETLSDITFSIRKAAFWDGRTYAKEKKRQADLYVFCVLKHTDQTTINPLDMEQWAFYPVATSHLEQAVGDQGHICLSSLVAHCGCDSCTYTSLKETVMREYAAFCRK